MKKVRFCTVTLLLFFFAACATPRGVDTGVTGLSSKCGDEVRPLLDCKGTYEQFARTMRFDVASIKDKAVGFGVGASQLMQLDSVTGDLLAHQRQICTEYNNCIISREEYRKEMAFLRRAQLKVREVATSFASWMPQGYPPGVGFGTVSSGEPPSRPTQFEDLWSDLIGTLLNRGSVSSPASGVDP